MLEKERIIHKKFGTGEVTHCDVQKMEAFFYGCNQTKRFVVDTVVENGIIIFNSENALKIIKEHREREKQEQIERRERQKQEERLIVKNKKGQVLSILNKYGFEGFLHTTELDNFKKIVEFGQLISRGKLNSLKIDFVDVANQEVIVNTEKTVIDSCRFYYYFKTPTNFTANYQHPAIMVFDENLIYFDKVYFTPKNAAKCYNYITSDIDKVLDFPWDEIFERGSYSLSKCYNKEDDKDINHNRITGLRNAEFLVNEDINLDMIKKVYFKSKFDMDEAKKFCNENLCSKFVLDGSKFD